VKIREGFSNIGARIELVYIGQLWYLCVDVSILTLFICVQLILLIKH